jgi:hypothetical protein
MAFVIFLSSGRSGLSLVGITVGSGRCQLWCIGSACLFMSTDHIQKTEEISDHRYL